MEPRVARPSAEGLAHQLLRLGRREAVDPAEVSDGLLPIALRARPADVLHQLTAGADGGSGVPPIRGYLRSEGRRCGASLPRVGSRILALLPG
jgi:hypothetical protein